MATTSWASVGRQLKKDVGDEELDLGKAAGKKSLWSSLGGAVGSLGMMAALGPLGIMANPLLAGLAVGGGSLVGSTLGGELLTSKKNKEILKGKAEGLKFLGDERKEISDEIISSNVASALTAGTTAGMSAWTKVGSPLVDKVANSPSAGLGVQQPNLMTQPLSTKIGVQQPGLMTQPLSTGSELFGVQPSSFVDPNLFEITDPTQLKG